MPYADRETIQSRSVKYLTEAAVTEPQLVRGQAFADEEINSRLHHLRPFGTPVPGKVTEIAADLAAYFLILDLFQNGTMDAPVEYAQELWRRSQEALDKIASGDAGLGSQDGEEEPIAPPASVRFRPGRPRLLEHFDGVHKPCFYPPGSRYLC